MKLPADIQARLDTLRQALPGVAAFAVVDGAQFELTTGERLRTAPGLHPVFFRTPEQKVFFAGPWLVEPTLVPLDHARALHDCPALEQQAPVLSWIVSALDLPTLLDALRERLNVELADGRVALLRYWDPRVLFPAVATMSQAQRDDFLAPVVEWLAMVNGRRAWLEGAAHA